MSDSKHSQEEIEKKRSSSDIRAASSDFGLIGMERKHLHSLRLSTREKVFFNSRSKPLPTHYSESDLKKFLEAELWRNSEPNTLIAGIFSTSFSLIPASLYEVHKPFPSIAIDRDAAESDQIIDSIHTLDLVVQFDADPLLVDAIKTTHPKSQIKFLYSGWLIALHLQSKTQDYFIGVHSSEDHMALAIFKKGKLQLFNIYQKNALEDVSYFTLYAIQKLDIPTQQSHLILSAPKEELSKLASLFEIYLSNVETAVTSMEIHPKNEVNSNFNYPLSNLYLCV